MRCKTTTNNRLLSAGNTWMSVILARPWILKVEISVLYELWGD